MNPLRVLVICPSWVGDVVMATPALRLVRSRMKGSFIGGLVRPGIDELLAGTDFFDEVHVERAGGVMGPKFAAGKLRPRRYEAALLLTNSFSTALIARVAGVPRRVGYNRDARGLLLTDRLEAPKRADGRWLPVSAVAYYWNAAVEFLERCGRGDGLRGGFDLPDARMELGVSTEQDRAGSELLERARVGSGEKIAVLNPGGNNETKRWPPDRFIQVGRVLREKHGMRVLVNGSPGESELTGRIAEGVNVGYGNTRTGGLEAGAAGEAVDLATRGITLGSLKAVVRRSSLMVTNDTGPRHIAAAFGVPVVSLFGPTDERWTRIPVAAGMEEVLVAEPGLREDEIADDFPERCRVEKIGLELVLGAVDRLLGRSR